MKVRSHIALLVAAVLLPIVMFSITAIQLLLAAEREAALRSMMEVARSTVAIMDQEMSFARATAQALRTSRILARGEFEEFYNQSRQADNRAAINTALIGADGQQVFNTVKPFGTPIAAPNDVARARVKAVLAADRPVVSNLIKGSATKKYVVSVEYPVTIQDGRRFLISQWMYVTRLNQLLPATNIPPSWLISVFDRDGITIARNKGAEQYVGQPPRPKVQRAILARFEGISRSVVREGIDMYGAWAVSRDTGWSVGVGVPVAEIERAAVRSVGLTAVGFLFAIAIAILGAVMFSRRLVGAIDKASAAAELLGQRQVPPQEKLAVEEMNRLHSSLHRTGVYLQQSETERNEHLANAEQARAIAEQAQAVAESQNKAKDEFLAMLGHELRNPLAAITSGVSLLGLPGVSEAQSRKATVIIERQTRQLSHLVDELLDAHRIMSGKLTLTKRPIDLAGAVQACLATFEARGAMRSHRMTATLAPAMILADPTRLEQMISNLLDNALKYTPEGGAIDVSVQAEDDSVILAVADSGIGIAPELLPTMFEVFVQGKVINRSKGGLGIGLAVVDSLARQHDATLRADSAGANQGSCFTIRFPRAPSAAAPVSLTPAASLDGAPPRARGRILVIEDNRDVREVMCGLLIGTGFDVQSAEDGASGLAMAAGGTADVALVDIDLPDMTGYDIARALRAAPASAGMGLIAVTGYGQDSDRASALASGFDAHLKKPVNIVDVIQAIDGIRARKAAAGQA